MIYSCLSKILGEKNLHNLSEIGRRTGLDRRTIADLCDNRWDKISRETMDKLCEGLGVSVQELFEYIPITPSKEKHIGKKKSFRGRIQLKTFDMGKVMGELDRKDLYDDYLSDRF